MSCEIGWFVAGHSACRYFIRVSVPQRSELLEKGVGGGKMKGEFVRE